MNVGKMEDLYAYIPPIRAEVSGRTGERVQSIDGVSGQGVLVYLENHPFPHKGLPTTEVMFALNAVKALLKSFTRMPLLALSPSRALQSFSDVSWKLMEPYILKEEFQMKATITFSLLVGEFLRNIGTPKQIASRIGLICGHLLEYDTAYRFRLQDLANVTSTNQLVYDLRGELKRLVALNRARDYPEVSDKVKRIGQILNLILLIPKYRRALIEAIKAVGIEGLWFDESDKYWITKKVDYMYEGVDRDPIRCAERAAENLTS